MAPRGGRTGLDRRSLGRDALRVARDLLGAVLVHRTADGPAAGRIVEVEAYRGPSDRAAHSFGGRRTPRNEVMYGPAGHAYVYFVYGMHHCVNVVAAGVGVPEAVLIRAVEAQEGLDLMRRRRGLKEDAPAHLLCRGPGNVCRALGIDRSLNGADLLDGSLTLEPAARVAEARVVRAPRVGVDYAGADAGLAWRFYEVENPAVSRPLRQIAIPLATPLESTRSRR